MHQLLWGYKVEDKLYVGVREQKSLNTTDINYSSLTFKKLTSLYMPRWHIGRAEVKQSLYRPGQALRVTGD
jgi:hypothetical protein